MIPKNIIDILLNHQDEVSNEISDINKTINNISRSLKEVSNVILDNMVNNTHQTNELDKDEELTTLRESQDIREYIQKLKTIRTYVPSVNEIKTVYVIATPYCPTCNESLKNAKILYHKSNDSISYKLQVHRCPKCNKYFIYDTEDRNTRDTNIQVNEQYYNKLSYNELIVVNNLKKCSKLDHHLEDIQCVIMTILPDGSIESETIKGAYCNECQRYFTTPEEYNHLAGVPICEVINQTIEGNENHKDSSNKNDYNGNGSKLTRRGYNVNCISDLTKEQRQTILGTQIYMGMSVTEIISFIDSFIHNGKQRSNWNNAVAKWQEDKKFVEEFNNEIFAEKVDINKIIFKYKRSKNTSL